MHNHLINHGAQHAIVMIAVAPAPGCGHAPPLPPWTAVGRGGLIAVPRGADTVSPNTCERLGLPTRGGGDG